jgi:hypothetical protein
MRSWTASETLAGFHPVEVERLDRAQVRRADDLVPEETSLTSRHGAVRGVLTGILVGAGAWGAIWVVAAALWSHRG